MSSNRGNKKHICVVVLGDFGRSPRMQYHSLSLAKHNYLVDVVAYKGSSPFNQVLENERIQIHYMKEVPAIIGRTPKIIQYILKTIWQALLLFWTLLCLSKMNCILLQNPPSIPTLPVCWLISWLRYCSLFVDFHNYGYTILSLSTGKKSKLVKFAKWCEMYFGRKANKSICVTKAMKDDLNENWNIRASVLYDCPPSIFHPISVEEKHYFFKKMSETYPQFKSKLETAENETRFTKLIEDKCELLPSRPALVVSSTSWTEDEDFSLLLAALDDYEEAATRRKDLPNLIVAITGKGHLKSYYEKEIKNKNFLRVEVITLWLKFEDYPTFLACADLGISLHSSSSGLDLPMKVVDMFGCCLPVCAVSFNCIDELVKNGENGLVFTSAIQLSNQLQFHF
nr:chitobiosyldiphosphodolichol beta-mannosyltransferase isoform X2 [Parasteatoda tepidariorum]XP_042904653.1 chitobiosyldiphosphodolichol beta-mannosyltransferase isoform X2 [Parasteatoda tepidariorum]